MKTLHLTLLAFFACIASPARSATELIVNGGFETGTLDGWLSSYQAGSDGAWFAASGTTTPLSSFATVGPASGNFYAVTDQKGVGAHVLSQSFTLPQNSGTTFLSFNMFRNNQTDRGGSVDPIGLDYTAAPNQHARVDILKDGASVFSTAAGDIAFAVVAPGVGAAVLPNDYTHYSLDLSSALSGGGNYTLRFGMVDNVDYFHVGVDDVSLTVATVPEPVSLSMLLAGLGALGLVARRRKA
jgi:hypothetical protein